MPMDYEDEEMDDFPMMAKRKMMRMMKAKKMAESQEAPEMKTETEMSLIKVEIKVGGGESKGMK